MEQEKETVTISKKEFDILKDDAKFLQILEDLGLSKLPIYQDAIDAIEDGVVL